MIIQKLRVILVFVGVFVMVAGIFWFVLRPSADVANFSGRIISSTGVSWGGLIAMNPSIDTPNVINLIANSYDTSDSWQGRRHKTWKPSTSNDGRVVFEIKKSSLGDRPRIGIVNTDGTNLELITNDSNDQVSDENPVISSNGNTVAFVSNRDNSSQPADLKNVFTINLASENHQLKKLTENQLMPGQDGRGEYRTLAWNPEGTKLAFLGRKWTEDLQEGIKIYSARTILNSEQSVYKKGEEVPIDFNNLGPADVTIPVGSEWVIEDESGEVVKKVVVSDELVTLKSNQYRNWGWDQTNNENGSVEAGVYQFELTYQVGPNSVTKTTSFTISDDEISVVPITATPVLGNQPLNVEIDYISSEDPSNHSSTYVLDYGDGTVEVDLKSPIKVSHAYNEDGQYRISLRSGTKLVGEAEVQVSKPLEGADRYWAVVGIIDPETLEETIVSRVRYLTLNADILDWSSSGIIYRAHDNNIILDPYSGQIKSFTPKQWNLSYGYGGLRFSPDGQYIVTTAAESGSLYADWQPTIFDLEGNSIVRVPVKVSRGEPLAWQQAEAIPKPARLEFSPNPVVLWDGHAEQIVPTLYDDQGNVIVHAVADWEVDARGLKAEELVDGRLTGKSAAELLGRNQNVTLKASNGGVSSTVPVITANTPIVSVEVDRINLVEENNDSATVTIKRVGDLSQLLSVVLELAGIATNRVDYERVVTSMTFPAGESVVSFNLTTIDDVILDNNETVEIKILEGGYELQGSQATITITDNDQASSGLTSTITSVSPTQIASTGQVTFQVFGNSFGANRDNVRVKMAKVGQEDIVGTVEHLLTSIGTGRPGSEGYSGSGQILTATFGLGNAAVGEWTLVVMGNDGNMSTQIEVTSDSVTEPDQVEVQVLGRNQVRSGGATTFRVLYSNPASLDARGIPVVVISGADMAAIQISSISHNFSAPPLPGLNLNSSNIGWAVTRGNGQVVIYPKRMNLCRIITQGSSSISFQVTNTGSSEFSTQGLWLKD